MVCKFYLRPFYLLIWTIFLVVMPGNGKAVEPSNLPILRIDGDMHTEEIPRIAVDLANRFFVSVSADKTIRVWSLPSGHLVRTIHVPIAAGLEGKLQAVAISSGGTLIAASGITGKSWDSDQGYFIYLFDTSTGLMRRSIGGLPSTVTHMAISPDGRYLAAVLGDRGGLRVFRIGDGRLLRKDIHYLAGGSWVDFNKNGQLITASLDGVLRLYDERFILVNKRQISTDFQPYSAVFSPDGNKIAVGFKDKQMVAVFSADRLEVLYLPDVSASIADFRTVCWSVDGLSLYGAGEHHDGRQRLIRWWKNAGQPSRSGLGEYLDLPATGSLLSQIIALRGGGVLFAGHDPVLGAMDAEGFFVFRHSKPSATFSNWQEKLLISEDGSQVGFPYDRFAKDSGVFSGQNIELIINKSDQSNLFPPLTVSSNLEVTGWFGEENRLKLNGRPLPLYEGERSNALSIARDGRFFVVGTETHLRMYDQLGRRRWVVPASSPIDGVNISVDGRVIIAAHRDGTIRWYRVLTGDHYLSFFPHRDQKRWIAWTPDKFFSASFKGDELIGWHQNRGRTREARFYPASAFKASYFKPERIRQLFVP
ncbi:MAG: hypothetical protein HQL67_01210 [Magnetococcales bacterium]|nr:hypothetical protein [Magnetococcales bacterium]